MVEVSYSRLPTWISCPSHPQLQLPGYAGPSCGMDLWQGALSVDILYFGYHRQHCQLPRHRQVRSLYLLRFLTNDITLKSIITSLAYICCFAVQVWVLVELFSV